MFHEESCTLFRERYEEKFCRAKSFLSKFNLSLPVTATQVPVTYTQYKLPTIYDESLKAQKSFSIKKTCEKSSLPIATSYSNQTLQLCSLSTDQKLTKICQNLKPKTDDFSSNLEKAKLEYRHILWDKSQNTTAAATTTTTSKCDYKLHLGQLHSEDMEELKQIEIQENHLLMQEHLPDLKSLSLNKESLSISNHLNNTTNHLNNTTNHLNNLDHSYSDSDKSCSSSIELNTNSSRETPTKSAGTIMIPNHLMNRWQSLFKPEESDSDSESEYDYEEDDPNSPYHPDMTLDIEPQPECLSILSAWVKSISYHEKDFLNELNQKVISSGNWTIVEERIQHPNSREVLGLADVSHVEKTRPDVSHVEKVRHGFYREFDVHGKDITSFGRYVDGQKVGVVWKRLEGNGFLVGANDNNNNQVKTSYYKSRMVLCMHFIDHRSFHSSR